ncbi:uncharacterized protein [Venturia canescens]|uniref:uncharacterized protein isoform X4 n=1 Tax=Venturia canescens TaxID=32260 RepID=UPI001C9C52C4|nr:uncharacterized protein LOC122411451 isoform X4 [Venturia canescens]
MDRRQPTSPRCAAVLEYQRRDACCLTWSAGALIKLSRVLAIGQRTRVFDARTRVFLAFSKRGRSESKLNEVNQKLSLGATPASSFNRCPVRCVRLRRNRQNGRSSGVLEPREQAERTQQEDHRDQEEDPAIGARAGAHICASIYPYVTLCRSRRDSRKDCYREEDRERSGPEQNRCLNGDASFRLRVRWACGALDGRGISREGQRKANFEECDTKKRESCEKIANLKKEIKNLRIKLAKAKNNEDAADRVAQTSRESSACVRKEGPEAAIRRVDEENIRLRRKLDLVKYQSDKQQSKLASLLEEYEELVNGRRRKTGKSKLEHPLKKKIISLENQLQRVSVMQMEADTVRKKYRNVRSNLKADAASYVSSLRNLENSIREQEIEIKQLQNVKEEAIELRDTTKETLTKQEIEAMNTSKARDLVILDYRQRVEDRKLELERLERMIFPASRQLPREDFEASGETATTKVDENGDCAAKDEVTRLEEAFVKLRSATGVTRTEDVLDRFLSQRETKEKLQKMRTVTENEKMNLERKRQKLTAEIESQKFSETKNADENAEELESLNRRISEELERRRKALSGKGRTEEISSAISRILWKFCDLLRMENLSNDSKSENEKIVHAEERPLFPLFPGRATPAVPAQASEDEEDVPTRNVLKRQAQLLVDTKSRRKEELGALRTRKKSVKKFSVRKMLEWAYDGVNPAIPRNVGPECANFLTPYRRILETILATTLIGLCLRWGYKRMVFPKAVTYASPERTGRKWLLVLMTLILGIEIGFKFTSRTIVYLLNPCHITTAVQLYLLSAKPSPLVTTIFRLHLNFLNGPVLAYLFPEIESRHILPDKAMYYLQHGLMLVIPYYLLRVGGAYNVESRKDLSWSIFAYGINLIYHWWILQAAAMPVQVNLSHILCPAILDPFGSVNYRIWAIIHQGLLCPLLCKLFVTLADYFITQCPLTKVKSSLELPIDYIEQNEKSLNTNENRATSEDLNNGHTHFD